MVLAVNIMEGRGLSNKVRRECCQGRCDVNVHFQMTGSEGCSVTIHTGALLQNYTKQNLLQA